MNTLKTGRPALRTPEQVREWFIANGINVSEWARANGVSRYTVYDLLRGKRVGRRGDSHRAAIALGMKADPESLKLAA